MKKWLGFFIAALLASGCAHAASVLQDGLYRDQAEGYGGKVIVTVTIRDGKITELSTENTGGEKSEYYLKAEEALTQEILEKQTLDGIDAVAGATGTSESILEAMRGVWEQAHYAPESASPEEPVNSVKEPTLTAWPHPTV